LNKMALKIHFFNQKIYMKILNYFSNLSLGMSLIFLSVLFLLNSFGQGFTPIIFDKIWRMLVDDLYSLHKFFVEDWDRELYNLVKLFITLSLASSLTSWLVHKTNLQANRSFIVFSISYFFILLQTLPLFMLFAWVTQEPIIEHHGSLAIFFGTILYLTLLTFFIYIIKKKLVTQSNKMSRIKTKIEWYWWLILFIFIPFAFGWIMLILGKFFYYVGYPLGLHPINTISLILSFIGLITLFFKLYLKLKKNV